MTWTVPVDGALIPAENEKLLFLAQLTHRHGSASITDFLGSSGSWGTTSTTVATGALIATTSAGKSKTAVAGTVNTSDAGASSDPTVGSFVMGRALTDGATDTNHIVDLHPMGLIPTTAA
jgi:hypothetical protein